MATMLRVDEHDDACNGNNDATATYEHDIDGDDRTHDAVGGFDDDRGDGDVITCLVKLVPLVSNLGLGISRE